MTCVTIRVGVEKTVLELGEIISPKEVSVGEEFEVKCNVKLKSGKSGSYTISLYVNAMNKPYELVKESVSLDVGETKIVVFKTKIGSTGEHKIGIAPSGLKDWSEICKNTFTVG